MDIDRTLGEILQANRLHRETNHPTADQWLEIITKAANVLASLAGDNQK